MPNPDPITAETVAPDNAVERAKTDESLHAERTNADAALAGKRIAEDAADAVIDTARSQADAVLDHAREAADDRLHAAGVPATTLYGAVASERAHDDSVLKQERAAADDRLRQEREQHAAQLESVLLTERAETDRFLLTERNRSDDAIAHRDDFLGMVAHDLRNHLNRISLEAQLGQSQASDSAEGRRNAEVMERMHRHAKQMARIVGDLVDIVGIDAGKLIVLARPQDASVLLTEAMDAFSAAAVDARISLVLERGTELLQASFDYERMLQVLSNFLSNAIKFTPPGGRVVLRGACDGETLRLTVSDTGPGIASHMLEAVFERFWQLGKNDQRGLGLGLYISRCIVEAHQGTILVDSTLGQGSRFVATIPCVARQEVSGAPVAAEQVSPNPARARAAAAGS